MIARVWRPVLLVEGDGDQKAVPELIRRVAANNNLSHIVPAGRPIKAGDIKKLSREGMLERFVAYAMSRDDGDSALLLLDCDDDCAVDVAVAFSGRLEALHFEKPLGMVLLVREFESLFLFSLSSLRVRFPEYDWADNRRDYLTQAEQIRGAKEEISGLMRSRTYKETQDQVRFVTALDWDILDRHSRSFAHLKRTLEWLGGWQHGASRIYPVAPR